MKKNIYKILKLSGISILLSIIVNFMFLKTGLYGKDNILDRSLIFFFIFDFIGMHFSFGIKKMYDYIIEKRYIISLILLIFLTLFSYTTSFVEFEFINQMSIFLRMVTFNKALYSFIWNLRIILLILTTFELCMIISNKNKFYSIAGTIIISFSSVLNWNIHTALIDVILLGEGILVLTNIFMKIKEKKILKIITMIGISIFLILYVCTCNLEYEVSFGYLFIALLIWIIIKNRKEYQFEKMDLICFIIPVVSVIISAIILNKIGFKPIKAGRTQDGFSLLMSYTYNILLPFKNIEHASYFSNIISVFPVPIIITFYYLYKKEDHTEYLFPIAVVVTLLCVHILSGLPKIISNLTLFNFVSVESAVVAMGFACVYLYIYILSNIDEKIFNIKYAIRITLITMCLIIFVKAPVEITTKNYMYLLGCVYCLFAFLLLNSYEQKYKKVFFTFAIIITIFSGILINPIVARGNEIVLNGKSLEQYNQNMYR